MRATKIIFWALVGIVIVLTVILLLEKVGVVRAAGTNISSIATSSVAWDDPSGYWDFYNTQNVTVAGTNVTGYASSSIGPISLDCASSPSGTICSTSNYGICNGLSATHNTDGSCTGGDASGDLSGFAWNDMIGWISFCGGLNTSVCPGTQKYGNYNGVHIDGSTGDLLGWAWNDKDGWISFNCSNNGDCSPQYKVNTSWRATSTYGYLTSSVFDTQDPNGAALKSIIWEGPAPQAGTCIGFQVAGSMSSSGPWTFMGPSSSTSDYYGTACSSAPIGGPGCAQPDTPICVDSRAFNAYRYYRYQVRLKTDTLQLYTPVVNDVILNFSQ